MSNLSDERQGRGPVRDDLGQRVVDALIVLFALGVISGALVVAVLERI